MAAHITHMDGTAMQASGGCVVVAAGSETVAATTALRSLGFRVVTADNTAEAGSAWLTHRPQAMVLDPALLGLGGLEVCRWVRRAGNTRIVVRVTVGDLATIAATFQADADDVVPKPFSPTQLVARLHDSLHRCG